MRQFCRVCVACCVTMFALCGIALIIGRTQSAGALMPGLGRCGDKWCYLGIVPGATTWSDAQGIFGKAPELTFDQSTRTAYRLPGLIGRMYIMTSNELVDEIDLNPRQPTVSAGEVV